MNILVTGASGFIGRRLALALAQRQPKGTLYCWTSPIRNDFEDSGKRLLARAGVPCWEVDLLTVQKSRVPPTPKPSVVFHLAANTGTWIAEQDANDYGTERLLDALSPLGPDTHVIFTSTIATLDNRDCFDSPVTSPAQVRQPLTRYGQSKLRAENILIRRSQEQGFRLAIVRLMTVYAPDSKPNSLLDVLQREVRKSSWKCRLNWPGKTGLVHADDVVRALMMIGASDLEAHTDTPAWSSSVSFNGLPLDRSKPDFQARKLIIQSEAVTVAEICKLLHRTFGKEYMPIYLPEAFWKLAWQGWKVACAMRFALPTNVFNVFWRAHLAMKHVFWADQDWIRESLPDWKPQKLADCIDTIVSHGSITTGQIDQTPGAPGCPNKNDSSNETPILRAIETSGIVARRSIWNKN